MMMFVYFVLGVGLGYVLRAVSVPQRAGGIRPLVNDDTVLVMADGKRVRWGDIPTDKAARADWLNEHCPCGKSHT